AADSLNIFLPRVSKEDNRRMAEWLGRGRNAAGSPRGTTQNWRNSAAHRAWPWWHSGCTHWLDFGRAPETDCTRTDRRRATGTGNQETDRVCNPPVEIG